jgi:hypothetical protein
LNLIQKLKLESKSIFRSFDYLGENFSRISMVCRKRTIGAVKKENVHPRQRFSLESLTTGRLPWRVSASWKAALRVEAFGVDDNLLFKKAQCE